MLFIQRVLVATLFILMSAHILAAEKRVALVIGNDAYQGVTKLEKAVSDAKAIGEALKKVGFEVLSYSNLDRRGMNQAIGAFTDKVAGGGVGVFFFAGHGVQAGGTNFLLPVDIKVKDEQDLLDEAVNMQRILERLSDAKVKLSLLVIDACRDNPFKKAHGRSIGAMRGLAVPQAPSGTLVVYSAGIGQQALDKLADTDNNPNGLFTREFLPAITTPGLRIDEAVKKVRGSVIAKAKAVGHEQNPAIYDQTDGDFYFVGAAAPSTAAKSAASPAQPVVQGIDPLAVEMSFWDSIRGSSDADDFQEYLRQYPQGKFAGLARNRLRALSQQDGKKPQLSAQETDIASLVDKAKDGDTAVAKEIRRLAEKGDGAAQYGMARIYRNGWGGVEKDEAQSLKWVRKAASQGNVESQHAMGRILESGRGTAKDEAEAFKWYRKAADRGFDRAQYRLGQMYETGRGVRRDEAEAVKWYRKAADQRHAAAQTGLGQMYEIGRGVGRDEAEAVRWFRMAAEQDNDMAQYKLGQMYRVGQGVAANEAEAVKWYRKAAEKGNKSAVEALSKTVASRSATASHEPSPKDFCADRPNFISKSICERRECEKPRNANDPYCEKLKQQSETSQQVQP